MRLHYERIRAFDGVQESPGEIQAAASSKEATHLVCVSDGITAFF